MASKVLPMYNLKPVEDPNTVYYYNSSMYKMRNINDLNLNSQTGSINSSEVIYIEIEQSQKIIFDHIASIKKQIEEIKTILRKRSQGKSEKQVNVSTMSKDVKSGVTSEIVINCDVNNPPYSLLVLDKLTKNIKIQITSHQHSSVKGKNELIDQFNSIKDNEANYKVRLIWSEQKGTTVTFGYVPLSGEVSLLRFVHSLAKQQLSIADEIKLQQHLDELNNNGVSSFEKIVNGSNHIVGNCLTVVDIALWSCLKSTKIDGKLKHWFQHFDKMLS